MGDKTKIMYRRANGLNGEKSVVSKVSASWSDTLSFEQTICTETFSPLLVAVIWITKPQISFVLLRITQNVTNHNDQG